MMAEIGPLPVNDELPVDIAALQAKLAACPFDGGTSVPEDRRSLAQHFAPVLHVLLAHHGAAAGLWAVTCYACSARVLGSTPAGAAKRWNTRATE